MHMKKFKTPFARGERSAESLAGRAFGDSRDPARRGGICTPSNA